MQSHELLRDALRQANAKEIAAQLDLSLSMIYKWAEPPGEGAGPGSGSGTTNPLDRMEALVRATGDTRLVQWICERAGGFFIHNPRTARPHSHFLIPATNEVIQEFADLLEVVANAASDDQITLKEAEKIRARWEELKSVTEGFVRCCEGGNFKPLGSNKK